MSDVFIMMSRYVWCFCVDVCACRTISCPKWIKLCDTNLFFCFQSAQVHGLSNYLCKLLSHLMSRYGMDKVSGCAKLLTDMGQPEIFNCGVLCDRAFMIDSEHLNIAGYGRDKSGSLLYLQDTLNVARENNDTEERLVPIHADGDGHCLVHAVSRALVGRELFWHPLRLNLMSNLRDNLDRYKLLLENFVDVDEWETIINECKPSFVPTEGEAEGLRNIHIFGLANVLKRPIILLDNLSGMSSSGDYSGKVVMYSGGWFSSLGCNGMNIIVTVCFFLGCFMSLQHAKCIYGEVLLRTLDLLPH